MPDSEAFDRLERHMNDGFSRGGSVEADAQPEGNPTRSRSRLPPTPTSPSLRHDPQRSPTPAELANIERILGDAGDDEFEDLGDDPCIEIRNDRVTLRDELVRLRHELRISEMDRISAQRRARMLEGFQNHDLANIQGLERQVLDTHRVLGNAEAENENLRDWHNRRQNDRAGRDQELRDLQEVNAHVHQVSNNLRIERDRLAQQLANARRNMGLQWQHFDRENAQLRERLANRMEPTGNNMERHENEVARLQRLLTDTRNERDNVHREFRRIRGEVDGLRAQQTAAADRSSTCPAPRRKSRSRTFRPSPPPAVGTYTDFTARDTHQNSPAANPAANPAPPAPPAPAPPAQPARPRRMNTRSQANARERSQPPPLFNPRRNQAARPVPPHAQRANPARPTGVSKRGLKNTTGRK